MNKTSDKYLRKLLCYSLVLVLIMSQAAISFAADEVADEQTNEIAAADEMNKVDSPHEEVSAPPEAAEPKAAEPETAEPEAAKPASQEPADTGSASAETVTEEVSEPEAAEPASQEPDEVNITSEPKAASAAAGTIQIGNTSFDPEAEESSQWKDGKGWKNISGQYVAMVDYDGRGNTISADGGVVTLAVAGINRIGAFTGDCSVQIIGTGIVLIDSLELKEGNYLSLHPNTALYEEGSAAVFLLNPEDGSYHLINGDVTGILDEEYILENTRLTIPDGARLVLNAISEVADGNIVEYGSRVIIRENSALTVNEGASVSLKKVKSQIPYVGVGEVIIEGELIIQGALNVLGIVEGGFVDVQRGGTLSGTGTVKSSEVCLEPGGNLGVSVENSSLTIKGNDDGSTRTVSATVNNSIIYLKGSNIDLTDLNVSGTSTLGVDIMGAFSNSFNKVGNITLSEGSKLNIASNIYDNGLDNGTLIEDIATSRDGLKDCYLEIYGAITGGAVSVLAGCVRYTGTRTDVYPAVPEGYASRVIVNGNGITSMDAPLNMTQAEALSRAKQDKIPVVGYMVFDDWETQKGDYRIWRVDTQFDAGEVSRSSKVTYPDLLRKLYLLDDNGYIRSNYLVAVELIYSDFSRSLLKASLYYPASEVDNALQNGTEFKPPVSLDNVIQIRVLEYWATGGFGGSSNTHVSSSFTGSGVIGGPGSGNVTTTGSGKVVYGTQPEPEQENPKPADPVIIVPATYNTGSGTADINNKTDKTDIKTASVSAARTATGTAAGTGELVVNVSLLEPKEKAASGEPSDADRKKPQIWQLTVTKAGMPVTDLKGTPVKVTVPFTVPGDWGSPTPEEIAEYSLYAVFADKEGKLTAYTAQYDKETGEVSFETEQVGNFVIVRFDYEKELFTEEFYKALCELKEIRAFIAELQKEPA